METAHFIFDLNQLSSILSFNSALGCRKPTEDGVRWLDLKVKIEQIVIRYSTEQTIRLHMVHAMYYMA